MIKQRTSELISKRLLLAMAMALVALSAMTLRQSQIGAAAKAPDASYVLAVCRDDNAVAVIDAATLRLLARIPVGDAPHEAVASADGRTAYVANYGTKQKPGNSLSVIDLAALKEVKRVDLGELVRPHGLAEVGGKIYFTAEGSKLVARYDPAADRVDWTAKTDQLISHMLAVSADGKKIYTANMLSNSVSVIETGGSPGAAKVTHIAVGKEPEGIALSPDGRTLWIGHRVGGLVNVIDTATNTVKETLTAGQLPLRMSYAPDGKRVFVVDPPGGALLVFDARTRKEVRRVEIDGAPVGIAFSTDGRWAFVTDLKNSRVVALDAQKLSVVGEVAVSVLSDGIAFAPATRGGAGGGRR